MSDPVQIPVAELREFLDEEGLREWVQHQRWYASKSRAVSGIEIVEGIALRDHPLLFLALVQTRFATGTHELYQLPLLLVERSSGDGDGDGDGAGDGADAGAGADPIARTDDWIVYDALTEPARLDLACDLTMGGHTASELGAVSG